jgi:predicted nucleic acid-binding protein
MGNVVIDTSAWIESFRPDCNVSLSDLVKDLITKNQVLLPGIIKAELLRGAKNKKEFNRLNDSLKGLTYIPVPEEFWDGLAEFSFGLLKKGITVPLTDTYIALLCIENQAALVHRDKHFDLIAHKSSLKILSVFE